MTLPYIACNRFKTSLGGTACFLNTNDITHSKIYINTHHFHHDGRFYIGEYAGIKPCHQQLDELLSEA